MMRDMHAMFGGANLVAALYGITDGNFYSAIANGIACLLCLFFWSGCRAADNKEQDNG